MAEILDLNRGSLAGKTYRMPMWALYGLPIWAPYRLPIRGPYGFCKWDACGSHMCSPYKFNIGPIWVVVTGRTTATLAVPHYYFGPVKI